MADDVDVGLMTLCCINSYAKVQSANWVLMMVKGDEAAVCDHVDDGDV